MNVKKRLLQAVAPALLGLAGLVSCASSQVIGVNIKPQYGAQDSAYITRVEQVDKKLVKQNDPKKVDLEVLVDSAYISHQDFASRDWWQRIKYAVEGWTASAFKEKFGIEIEIDSVKYVKFDSVGDSHYLFAALRLMYDPQQFDGIVAFTGIDCKNVLGIAEIEGNHSMVTDLHTEGATFQHEFSHLYGALDIKEGDSLYGKVWSVMSYHPILGNTNVWDEPNARRIERHKDRDWKYDAGDWSGVRKHINGFETPGLRKHVAQLFCYSKAREFHQEGLDLGKELMALFPADSKIRFYHSQILKKMKPDDVLKEYKKIIGLNPDDADILNVIAWDMITEYNTTSADGLDAVVIAKKAVQIKPKDYIIDTLGWAYYKKGDLENASKELEQACQSTKDSEIFKHLIEVYGQKKDYAGYCSSNERLLKLDSDEAGSYVSFANGLMGPFCKLLDSEKKEYVLDLALRAYEICPVDEHAELVRSAYALNYERWDDPEFRRKYNGRLPK